MRVEQQVQKLVNSSPLESMGSKFKPTTGRTAVGDTAQSGHPSCINFNRSYESSQVIKPDFNIYKQTSIISSLIQRNRAFKTKYFGHVIDVTEPALGTYELLFCKKTVAELIIVVSVDLYSTQYAEYSAQYAENSAQYADIAYNMQKIAHNMQI